MRKSKKKTFEDGIYHGRKLISREKGGIKKIKNVAKVSSGTENIEKWQKAILRKNFIVKSGQVVCEKHFLPEDIIWKREVKDPHGNVMATENYKISRLRKGALPSIFPNCPKFLSKQLKERKSPKKRKITSDTFEAKRRKVLNTTDVVSTDTPSDLSEGPSASLDVPVMPDVSDAPLENTENVTDIERIALFESLFICKDSFKLPTAWIRCDINDGDFRAIQFMQCTGRMNNGVIKIVSQKKVVLYKDMTVHASVMDAQIKNQEIGFPSEYISSVKEVEDMIDTFHKREIYQGCASPNSVRNSETVFTFRDSLDTLRHNKCSLNVRNSTKGSKIPTLYMVT